MGAERGWVSRSRLEIAPRWLSLMALLVLALANAFSASAYGQADEDPGIDMSRVRGDSDPTLGATLVDARPREPAPAESQGSLPQIDLQSSLRDTVIVRSDSGTVIRIKTEKGRIELTPEQYVQAIQASQDRAKNGSLLHRIVYRVFNITKPWSFLWISIGLLGQVMFTFRMLLQWWATEKHKRVVVPTAFWWGSLFGGAMLFAYFCWRKDAIGIIGQSTGVFVYARNLVIIYRGKGIETEGARPVDKNVEEGANNDIDIGADEDFDEHMKKSVGTPQAI
jgi:lipid-A-disaccharide synthase-like uncharacterized protein